jgi:hypothetical protein
VGCSAYIHGYDLFITIVPDKFYNGIQVATSGQWFHPTVLLSVFGVPVGWSPTRTLLRSSTLNFGPVFLERCFR